MLVEMLKSKIHRAVVTGCDLNYEGSLLVPSDLIRAAGMLPNEKVLVVNCNNGSRLWTYLIEGETGSGEIRLKGAAARLGEIGDTIIIMTFTMMEQAEAAEWRPKTVRVDSENRIIE